MKNRTNDAGPPESSGALRPAAGLEALFDWPLAAATMMGQANVRLLEELMSSGRRSQPNSPSLPWTTANRVALELASMRLRDFSTGADGTAALICAPYALHSAVIADFAGDHSVVESLCRGGLSRVFVTDWRSATAETRYFTIDSHLADLNVAVDQLGPPVDLIGLCQGGWLALVYAARFPNKVRRLVLVGAPIDIAAAQSQLSRFTANLPLSMFEELVQLGDGIVHGDRMLQSWGVLTNAHDAEAVLQYPQDLDPARRQELSARFRQWDAETVDLPGTFYLQVVKGLFQENQIARGCFVALGQQIDLKQFRAPICLLAGGNDEIVAVDQLFATASLVGTPAEHLEKITEPCGHLNLFLGAEVIHGAWGQIAGWLRRDLGEPRSGASGAVSAT
ncbi:alpha/beta fold hydrolase [Bradyrhizobium sp.]|jgi:poly(3-hydroxyalkanoate) synthetase|uniref:alpha/beta fold hydrolase n=1 Tax=Bradyrhizobium sp. TaxID=376 RepID=UPI003C17AD65